MSDRLDFYFRQRVTELELDTAFELLENADRNFAADLNIYGIVSGAVPTQHTPVANLTVDLTAPGRAYDNVGQRIFFGTGQNIDCSVDLVGISTDVTTALRERWLGIFLRFKRDLSDPRTDGNSQQVFFRRDESFEIVVRQGVEAAVGLASRVPIQDEELLVCDVLRRAGQTQILNSDISNTRRQTFVFAQGSSLAVNPGLWSILAPANNTVQAAFDATDTELSGHFGGTARRHGASAINYTPHGFLAQTNVQSAMNELVDDLSSTTTNAAGAGRVGADLVTGIPNSLSAGTVDGQLSSLLSFLNTHVGAVTGAHNASAIAALVHNYITSTNVQSQIQDVVSALLSTSTSTPGASRVGVGDSAGKLNATNVEAGLAETLDAFDDGHFRGNETGAGQHRAIIQPALPTSGGKVLVWDCLGTNSAGSHLRVYADDEGYWFLINAQWDGSSAWTRDTGWYTGGLRISRQQIQFVHEDTFVSPFTDFTKTWTLSMSGFNNTSFATTGAVSEVGRAGIEYTNSSGSAVYLIFGSSCTFRSTFASTPSSITFSGSSVSSNWTGTPSLWFADQYGFGYYHSSSVNGGSSIYWYGTYTAVL